MLFAEITVLIFSLSSHTIIPPFSALNQTSAFLNPMVGSVCLMQTCTCGFTAMQCWIFVSNVISLGIPKKVLSATQPRMTACNLRLTIHRKMFASLFAPALYLLSRVSTAWSVVHPSAIVFWKASICTRRLPAPTSIFSTYTASRKSEIVVKDFTSYPSEFPFKDPSCLTRPGYSATEIEEMHQEDLAAEACITAELTALAVTRSQSAQMASKQ